MTIRCMQFSLRYGNFPEPEVAAPIVGQRRDPKDQKKRTVQQSGSYWIALLRQVAGSVRSPLSVFLLFFFSICTIALSSERS